MSESPSFLAAEAGDLEALEQLAAEEALEPDDALAGAAEAGRIALMAWSAEKGATNFDRAMVNAAEGGYIEAMAWCTGKGATTLNWAMGAAAGGNQIDALAWCTEKGASDFTWAMACAARHGCIEAMRWCAAAGRLSRGHRAFTDALVFAVNHRKGKAAELCLAWGGDFNHPGISKTAWVKALRAGEIAVEPQDPPDVHDVRRRRRLLRRRHRLLLGGLVDLGCRCRECDRPGTPLPGM